jgi:hypothetical protein
MEENVEVDTSFPMALDTLVMGDSDLDNFFVSAKVFLEDVDDTIFPAVIFVSEKMEDFTLLEEEPEIAEIETIEGDMADLEDLDEDNTLFPAGMFVSDKVDADCETIEYVGGSLHKVITHLRIIAFESRRTHT